MGIGSDRQANNISRLLEYVEKYLGDIVAQSGFELIDSANGQMSSAYALFYNQWLYLEFDMDRGTYDCRIGVKPNTSSNIEFMPLSVLYKYLYPDDTNFYQLPRRRIGEKLLVDEYFEKIRYDLVNFYEAATLFLRNDKHLQQRIDSFRNR